MISDGTPGASLTKIGQGQVVFAGANTYTGVTTINEGVLTISNPKGLGAASAGTVVAAGAALGLQCDLASEAPVLRGDSPRTFIQPHSP